MPENNNLYDLGLIQPVVVTAPRKVIAINDLSKRLANGETTWDKLTGRQQLDLVADYSRRLTNGSMTHNQIPSAIRQYVRPNVAEEVRRNKIIEEKEKERYKNSSTGRFTNLMGNVVTGTMALPVLDIAGSVIGDALKSNSPRTIKPSHLPALNIPNYVRAAKLAGNLATSILAGEAVNELSKNLTGLSWGQNVNQNIFIPVLDKLSKNLHFSYNPDTFETIGEFTNPGYMVGLNASNTVKSIVPKYKLKPKPTIKEYDNFGGEFIDNVSTHSYTPEKEYLTVQDVLKENPVNGGFRNLTLKPSQAEKKFAQDVADLNYYALNRGKPKTDIEDWTSVIDDLTVGNGSEGGAWGSEAHVVFPKNNKDVVYKIIHSPDVIEDEAIQRAFYEAFDERTPRSLKDLKNYLNELLKFKNKYIMSAPSSAGYQFDQISRIRPVLQQRRLTPFEDAYNSAANDAERAVLKQDLERLRNNSYFRENGFTLKDDHAGNVAYDNNGYLWGIDLWKQGGKLSE